MKKLLIATTNKGKLKEITAFLSDVRVQTVSLAQIGVVIPFHETGKTYWENSRAKACFYAKKSGLPAIADDGGIEIAALGGAPGIKSNRWLGPSTTEEGIIKHLKKISKTLPDNNRKASFKTIVSLALPNGKVWSAGGKVDGIIAKEPLLKREKGYPYRSFFYLPKIKRYYHEKDLPKQLQKVYNHRYKAVQKLKPTIIKTLGLKDYSDK